MSETPLLGLPLLVAAQAQKHVTHNEALLRLDAAIQLAAASRALAAPPAAPVEGDRYLVASPASGAWAGHAGEIAAFEAGLWRFATPRTGSRLWIEDEEVLLVLTGGLWRDLLAFETLQNLDLLGVNATADAGNRLTVAAPATLLNHEGGDHRLKINKSGTADTAALLFQTGFSGRAELGLAGDDDFRIKVSADGATWLSALEIDAATGIVTLPLTPSPGLSDGDKGDVVVSGGGAVWTIDANAVTNAKAADMPASTIKGNNAGASGDPLDLTVAQVKTLLAYTPGDIGAQPLDSDLTAIAGLSTSGLIVRTGAGTAATRSLAGTSGKITVTNGDGVAGNPTVNVGADIADRTAANTYTAGQKQTVQHSATTAGLNVAPASGDPSAPADGDLWYNSTTGKFRKREGGATSDMDTGGAGGVTDGDKGDIVVSGSGTVWTVETHELRKKRARQGFEFYSDFLNSIAQANGEGLLLDTRNGTGAQSAAQATDAANHPGLVRATTGTTATGRTAPATPTSFMRLGGGETYYETLLNVTALSTGTERFQLIVGFLDVLNAANQVDAVAFVYDEGGVSAGSAASANWQCLTASNSVRTWTGSGQAVAAATWVRLGILVNAAGTSVDFLINGTVVATVTTNIPVGAGRETGFGWLLIKSIGTAARTVDVDYLLVSQLFSTER